MPRRRDASSNEPPASPAWGEEVLRIVPRTESRIVTDRPFPGEHLAEDMPETFMPAPLFAEWIKETFIIGGGPLANEEHHHLLEAKLCVLWTNAINVTKQRTVYATAEIPASTSGGWKRSRFDSRYGNGFRTASTSC